MAMARKIEVTVMLCRRTFFVCCALVWSLLEKYLKKLRISIFFFLLLEVKKRGEKKQFRYKNILT